eukprot:417440-Amphidinium_carterae.1
MSKKPREARANNKQTSNSNQQQHCQPQEQQQQQQQLWGLRELYPITPNQLGEVTLKWRGPQQVPTSNVCFPLGEVGYFGERGGTL